MRGQSILKTKIREVQGTISNERIWELGYNGKEPNPHTQNIALLLVKLGRLEKLSGMTEGIRR